MYFLAYGESFLDDDFHFHNGALGLWRTDGTEAGTIPVTDLLPGVIQIDSVTEVNGRMLLSIESSNGSELWAFDGTEAGTQRIHAFVPTDSEVVGDQMYFASNSNEGRELYVTDGTLAGTRLVMDLAEGPTDSNPQNLVEHQGQLLFEVNAGNGQQLWITDGTPEGTEVVFSDPTCESIVAGDKFYFTSETEL